MRAATCANLSHRRRQRLFGNALRHLAATGGAVADRAHRPGTDADGGVRPHRRLWRRQPHTGVAWFDDLSLVKVDDSEAGDAVYNFYTGSTADSGGDWGATAVEEEPPRYTETLLLGAFGYVLRGRRLRAQGPLAAGGQKEPCAVGRRRHHAGGADPAAGRGGENTRATTPDIGCFEAWSERMAQVGPLNFYAEGYFCDYPPGYMLLLAPVALLRSLFGIAYDSTAHIVLLKLAAHTLRPPWGDAGLPFQRKAAGQPRGAASVRLLRLQSCGAGGFRRLGRAISEWY